MLPVRHDDVMEQNVRMSLVRLAMSLDNQRRCLRVKVGDGDVKMGRCHGTGDITLF